MAKVKCRAVIMDRDGEGETVYAFEAEDGFFERPADEIVEAFMRHLDGLAILTEPVRYELNAAKRYPERDLIGAMGSLLLENGGRLPFTVLIGPG